MQWINLGCFVVLYALSTLTIAHVNDYFATIQSNPKALYSFFESMPKGGELHYHLAGGAYPEVMLTLATENSYCIDPKTAFISAPSPSCALQSKLLKPKSKAYERIIEAWSMKHFKATEESGHDHFFASFFKFLPIASNHPTQLLMDTLKRAAKQRELYLEVMISPDNAHATSYAPLAAKYTALADKQHALLAHPAFLKNIHQTIQASQRLLSDTRHDLHCDTDPQQDVCHITVTFQYIVLREQSPDEVFAQALNGFEAASRSNDIVGINLVQAEDGVISMRDYQTQMAIFNFLHQAYPKVHIALHAGELSPSIRQVPPSHTHIQDAIVIGHAERIGHGVDILSEDNPEALFHLMAKKPVPVEINLTSNRLILNVTGQQHPLRQYLAHDVPVILSTDDEGILRTNLTQQYVEAVIQHHLDYNTLKTINRNTLTYSFLPGKSLWTNPYKHTPVSDCKTPSSPTCLAFIKQHQKARLQWQLEQNLIAFERRWR